jgi:quercetin dioxygenase-like cupin family protein
MNNYFHDWNKMEWSTIIPGYRAKFVHSNNMTFALWDVDEGASLPEHSHPHEQVTHLLEGKFEITIDANTKVLQAGQIATIPSNTKHSGKAITACRIFDAFYPVREDYVGA